MTKRAIFFLRWNNDTDHISPVIYHWSHVESRPATIIIYSTLELFKNDYRIEFLRTYPNVEILHLVQFAPDEFKQMDANPNTLAVDGGLALNKPWIQNIFDHCIRRNEKAVIVFDHCYDQFQRLVCRMAKEQNIPRVFFPHGGTTFCEDVSKVNTGQGFDLEPPPRYNFPEDVDSIATVVVTNSPWRNRIRADLDSQFLRIVGSARYAKEWRPLVRAMYPKFEREHDQDAIKVALFLRSKFYPIWWEEIAWIIALVSQLENVHLVVQHHTSENGFFNDIVSAYPQLQTSVGNNLEIVTTEVTAGALVDWSDIVIDVGTSCPLEAIIDDKPVLELEYVHGYRSIISENLPECEVRYRDEFVRKFREVYENPKSQFYDEQRRQDFLKNEIGPPEQNNVAMYSDILVEVIESENK